MDQDELIAFVQANGYPTFTARQLKRFREEKVVEVQVEHPGFGGTTSLYQAETGQRVLAVCALLRKHRNFNVVRFRLWLEGAAIEIGLLKTSIWSLTPFSTWKEPATGRERQTAAHKLARKIFNAAWNTVRTNFARKVLQNFDSREDQQWFLNLETQLLYGVPLDFTRDFLSEGESRGQLEEPADIFAHGLQTRHLRWLPKDIAEGLQDISDKQLLSWTKLKAVLFAATIEELELARERQDVFDRMLECLEIMGYLGKLHRLARTWMKRPAMQALLFCALLAMEQNGYGPNLEEISTTVRINWPVFKRMQEFRATLQQELPAIAKEILPLPTLGKKLVDGTPQERDAYFAHLQDVYQQNKEALDAFWQRHPALKGE
jgi:hypothetical protein